MSVREKQLPSGQSAELRLRAIAEDRLRDRPPAHDLSHVARVAALAKLIAEVEGVDVDVAVAAAWMHEHVNPPKNHPHSARSGDLCAQAVAPTSPESRVLQDADRLDAIGAIGIARCFATTTEMRRPFYSPTDPFCRTRPPDDESWGLDHFYRKLLRIPALLHTETARRLAVDRARAMEAFLDQLAREIDPTPP